MNRLPEGEKEEDLEKQTELEYEGEEYEQEKQEEKKGKGFCVSCCGCLLTLFEKYIRYFTHHVYIQVRKVLKGKS